MQKKNGAKRCPPELSRSPCLEEKVREVTSGITEQVNTPLGLGTLEGRKKSTIRNCTQRSFPQIKIFKMIKKCSKYQ
eukprot:2247652-Amphidinium_carterae.1